jgi:hypothetical protein
MQTLATSHLTFRLAVQREKRRHGGRPQQQGKAPAGELAKQAARELGGELHAVICEYTRTTEPIPVV